MSASFDPYHKWLGIGPKDQPPHHYRLLGLEPFEADLQVIEAAADRQLGFLRRYQSGEHATSCQKLLNEVSRARLCLLKPASKAAYDADLRELLEGGNEFPDIDFAEDSPDKTVSVKKSRKKRDSKSGQLVIGGVSIPIPAAIGGGLLVVVIAGLIVFSRGPSKPPVPAVPPSPNPIEVAEATPAKSDSLTKAQEPSPTVAPGASEVVPDGSDDVKSKFFGRSREQKRSSKQQADLPRGQTIDVLPLLNKKHVVVGNWKIEPNRLESLGYVEQGQIALPVKAPLEYTLHLKATRLETPDAKSNAVGLVLVYGGFRSLYGLDYLVDAGTSGLNLDSRGWIDTQSLVPGFQTQVGKPFELDAIVRKDGVEVRLDGRTLLDWHGAPSQFSLGPGWNRTPDGQLVLVAEPRCVITELTLGDPLPPRQLPGTDLKPGQTVDLLPFVDLKQDVWAGTIVKAGSALKTDTSFCCRFSVPYLVPDEYQLDADIETVLPANEFYFGLPIQSGMAGLSFAGNKGQTNFLTVDRIIPQTFPGRYLQATVMSRPRMKVRANVNKNHVQVQVGDQSVFNWKGDSRRCIALNEWATPGNRVTFGSTKTPYQIHSLKLTRLPPSVSPFAPPAVPAQGDLLKIVDTDRDTLSGQWTVEKGTLTSYPDALSAVRFPARLPRDYEFRVVVERKAGNELLALSLPVGSQSFMVTMDEETGTVGGIEFIDGLRCNSNRTTTKYTTPKFTAGIPQVIQGAVRGNHLHVDIGGKQFLDLDLPELVADPSWKLRPGWLTPEERLQIALTTASSFSVSEVRFRPLTDTSPSLLGRGMAASNGGTSNSPTPSAERPPMPNAPGAFVIPDDSARQAAAVKIREAFASDFSQLKTDADKLALAAKLEKLSAESKNDLATRYVCLELGREFAVEAGDVDRAFAVADRFGAEFAFDALQLKSSLAKPLAPKVKGALLNKEFVEKLFPLIDELKSTERFPQAVELATVAGQAAIKAKDKAAQADAGTLKKEAEELGKEFVIASAARKLLEGKADDAHARVIWGRWLCLRKGNWEQGLPLLVAGDDPQLQGLAKRDLQVPAGQAEMVQLSNDWLTFAKSKKDHVEAQFADRAMYWLQQAIDQSSGLEKTRNERLLAEALEVRDWDSPLLALLEQVEKKVAQGRYQKSTYTTRRSGDPFESVFNPPGILIGLNCAVRIRDDSASVKAIQPVYFTKIGEHSGSWYGSADGAQQVVEVRARSGYAINGFASQVNNGCDNIQISFGRVSRLGLDVGRTYHSPLIGLQIKKPEAPSLAMSGNQPIIGMFGNADNWLQGFGVIFTK